MIRSRLSYVRFNLKILTLLLPACSYFIAVKVRFGFNLFFSRTRTGGIAFVLGHRLTHHDRLGDRSRRVGALECGATVRAGREKQDDCWKRSPSRTRW